MLKPYSKRNTKKKLKPCNSFNMCKIGLTLIYYKDSHIISIPYQIILFITVNQSVLSPFASNHHSHKL